MTAYHQIPSQALDVCEQFLTRLYDAPTSELFIDSIMQGDRGRAIAILEEALSSRDAAGFPTGPRGLPSERLTAKRVIDILERQGPDICLR